MVRFGSSWINRLRSRYEAGYLFDFQVDHQKLRFVYFEKLSLNVERVKSRDYFGFQVDCQQLIFLYFFVCFLGLPRICCEGPLFAAPDVDRL